MDQLRGTIHYFNEICSDPIIMSAYYFTIDNKYVNRSGDTVPTSLCPVLIRKGITLHDTIIQYSFYSLCADKKYYLDSSIGIYGIEMNIIKDSLTAIIMSNPDGCAPLITSPDLSPEPFQEIELAKEHTDELCRILNKYAY